MPGGAGGPPIGGGGGGAPIGGGGGGAGQAGGGGGGGGTTSGISNVWLSLGVLQSISSPCMALASRF